MDSRVRSELELVLDREIRPVLASHGGDVELVRVEGDCAFVRYRGACQSCPSAAFSTKELIEQALCACGAGVRRVEVVTEVSEQTLSEVKRLLQLKRGQGAS